MNYCTKYNELCESANAFGYCSLSVPCSKYMEFNNISAISAIEKTQDENDDDIIIGTTPEYFARLAEDEINVQKAIDFLKKLDIRVKTEYGNYRPTYDVLRDIGDAMSRA
jgi:hypothetical protein